MPVDHKTASEPRPAVVLDPEWEVELRAGQEAEGEQGSVEDELAIVHLLRHARAPHDLDDARFDSVWEQLDGELDAQAAATGWRAWLRRPWAWVGAASMAAAAAAVVVVVSPGPGPDDDSAPTIASATTTTTPEAKGSMAATIEAQFQMLEPGARSAVRRSVDAGRDDLRGELVAEALRADGRSLGGAP